MRYEISPVWPMLLKDWALSPKNILARAGLAPDLFEARNPKVTASEYFTLFSAMLEESGDALLLLQLAKAFHTSALDPLVYAGLCSPHFNHAARRIATYKRLLGPVLLVIETTQKMTRVIFEARDVEVAIPQAFWLGEAVWWVAFVRHATLEEIRPATLALPGRHDDAYIEYFGCPIKSAAGLTISFHAEDAALPFLAADDNVWSHLEPSFQKRLATGAEVTASARVREAFTQMLPAGEATLTVLCKRLGRSPRTLQRQLVDEGTTYQTLLRQTRERLAKHYLASNLSHTEISLLLGYDDPNSFFRAFHQWTGRTPESTRAQPQT